MCEAVVALVHFMESVAHCGQFQAAEGNVVGTKVTRLGVGWDQGGSTGSRSCSYKDEVPGRLVDPLESEPVPVIPL